MVADGGDGGGILEHELVVLRVSGRRCPSTLEDGLGQTVNRLFGNVIVRNDHSAHGNRGDVGLETVDVSGNDGLGEYGEASRSFATCSSSMETR